MLGVLKSESIDILFLSGRQIRYRFKKKLAECIVFSHLSDKRSDRNL
jgi:hypothetical protein